MGDSSSSTATLVGIVAFLAFIGNVLITLVGLKLPAHPKNLTQVFLISLSVADILLSLQVPFYVMGLNNGIEDWVYFKQNPEETSTTLKVFCSISSFLLWTTIKANIFMVMVMGLDRMAATCYAATYLKKVKRQYAIIACTIVWVLSILLAALPGVIAAINSDLNPYSYDKRFRTCTPFPDFCRDDESKPRSMSHFLVYFLIEFVVTFIIPLICIIICYLLICSKIFNLKKIRTISRHFSKKQIFKSGKNDKNKQGKPPSPEEGSSKEIEKSYEKESQSNASLAMINTEDHSVEVEKKNSRQEIRSKLQISNSDPERKSGFRININQTADQQISEVPVYPVENKPQGFKLNISTSAPPRQPKFGLYPATSRVSNECSEVVPEPSTRNAFSLYPDAGQLTEECCDETLPNMTHHTTEPQQYSIDPTMQRRRFNFFTSDGDSEFAECPEPGSKSGILASSINVIEKHYNAIEAAQKELAKKMRIYKFQIRVARTAVVVCTFFFVCYLAYEIGTLMVIWGYDCRDDSSKHAQFIKMCHVFLFLNSALNVLVYGLMHRTVRAHLSKICATCTGKSASSST